MTIPQLMQLYPQLSGVDPKLLSMLSGKSQPSNYYTYGDSGMATPLSATSISGMPATGNPLRSTGAVPSNLVSAGLSGMYGYAKGGTVEHIPEFITGKTGHYVQGAGDGQSDSIPAMLADGEYVFDADTVSALGNGSSDAGAKVLDKMRERIRMHKRSAPVGKIPPKARSPLSYMKG